MQRLLSASAAVLALSFAASAASAQNFSDLARQDLQAMHAALRDNHPAAVVPGDASAPFRAWLDAGLQQAQAKAGKDAITMHPRTPKRRRGTGQAAKGRDGPDFPR